ncbi:hypothetical protein JXQ31_18770 [candidate division KSB1 bacterium]|nr:hypothetical protein [candidate division KSB1 bacterium]
MPGSAHISRNRYNNFDRVSHDIQFSFWWGRNILSEKINLTGHFVIWS